MIFIFCQTNEEKENIMKCIEESRKCPFREECTSPFDYCDSCIDEHIKVMSMEED